MKKTFLSLAVCALFVAVPKVANSADVSVDFFYNNLSGGSWVEVGDYGYCWQPDVAVGNASWRPYSDGYWAYTDLGWTWVSYEDFGWATYHYGRWTLLDDYGWVWVPGRDADLEWGPAWVSWRYSDDYVGWAPLPPETIALVETRPLSGAIDVEFNIGPACYNFVEARYIGEPVLRERIIAPTQNITYIEKTVNVTNITYQNRTVYNYGPDVNIINRRAARPVQRLRLEREQNVDVASAAKSGRLTKVQGDRLLVAAPMRVSRSARQVAPPQVKPKVEAARVDRGWKGVGDENAQKEFKQRLRQQRASAAAGAGSAGGAQGGAAGAASPAPGAATQQAEQAGQAGQFRERGRRGQGRRAEGMTAGSPGATALPGTAASPAEATADEGGQGRGRGQGRRGNRLGQPAEQTAPAGATSPAQAGASPNTGAAAETGGAQDQGRGRGRNKGQEFAPGQTPGAATAVEGAGTANEQAQQGAAGQRGRRAQTEQSNPEAQGAGAGQIGRGEGRQGRRFQNQPAETAPGDAAAQQGGGRRQRERGQAAAQGAAGETQQGEGQGQGQGRRGGKQGQGQASPAPTPQ